MLGAGGTSSDLLISCIMERARKGAKMKPGKDPTEGSFGAFNSSDANRYRNEHDRKGQGHDKGSESFQRKLDRRESMAGRKEGRQLQTIRCALRVW